MALVCPARGVFHVEILKKRAHPPNLLAALRKTGDPFAAQRMTLCRRLAQDNPMSHFLLAACQILNRDFERPVHTDKTVNRSTDDGLRDRSRQNS